MATENQNHLPGYSGTPEQPRKADKYIWAIYIALLAISIVELYSASSREVQASNVFGPLLRHGMMLLLGIGITVGLSRLKFKWLYSLTPVFVVFALVVAVYVLFKGQIINGARRSMSLFGIALQSAELLKLAVVLFIARIIAVTREREGVTTGGVMACAAFVLLCGGLLFSQGLTNTILLMGISMSMMLIGGVQLKKFALVLVAYGVIAGCGMIYKARNAETAADETTMIAETGKDAQGNRKTMERTGTWRGRLDRWAADTVPKYDQPITAINRQKRNSIHDYRRGLGLCGRFLSAVPLPLPIGKSRGNRLQMQPGVSGAPCDGYGSDDSPAGALPYGYRDRRIPRLGTAAAADFKRRLLHHSHLDRFRHHALGKPFRGPDKPQPRRQG